MEPARSQRPVRSTLRAVVTPHRARKPASILLVLTEGAPSLIREACRHARAHHDVELFCVYVCEPRRFRPADEKRAIEAAACEARDEAIGLSPVTRQPGDVADAVMRAAEESGARTILINGVERRGLLERLRGRRLLKGLRRRLSPERSILVYD
jgi:hypothetical protein